MSKTNHHLEDDLEINSQNQNQDNIIELTRSKLALAKKLLENIRENQEKLSSLLGGYIDDEFETRIGIAQMGEDKEGLENDLRTQNEGRIVEGVFDGENMIGPDGKQYSVPANYASKSKLVEGDILKLTITATGTFVYKQIGPIERKRVVANLEQEPGGNFIAVADKKRWHLLTASVTYFKGKDGDEIVILVPKTGESKWAAVENIVKKSV